MSAPRNAAAAAAKPNDTNSPNGENVPTPAKRGRKPKAPVLGDSTIFLLVVNRNGTTDTEMFDSYNDAMAGVGVILGDIANIDRATLVEVTGTKPIFQHERASSNS